MECVISYVLLLDPLVPSRLCKPPDDFSNNTFLLGRSICGVCLTSDVAAMDVTQSS